MKNIISTAFLGFSLLIANTALVNAAMYKGVDAAGNVVYSDKPFEAAEEYSPPPISVVDTTTEAVAAKPADSGEAATEADNAVDFKYHSFDIVSPKNNDTIRNDPDVTVQLNIKPGLNAAQGHRIWMLVDGKPVVKDTQNLEFEIGRLIRGAHKLQAQIRDKNGKVLVRTRTNVVFAHHTSGG